MENFAISKICIMEKDNLRAIVTVKVADTIFLTGIRVIEGKRGLFISMANRRTAQGEYQDIYFPASKKIRDELSALVLAAYEAERSRVPA